MENEKMFELLELIASKVSGIETEMKEVKGRLQSVENIVIRIENDHGNHLKALHDGYAQNSAKLDRIEKEVSRQEEVILRKIK
ncbi:MAG: hypothetical protein AAGU75_13105 [Bacillota bacterium]